MKNVVIAVHEYIVALEHIMCFITTKKLTQFVIFTQKFYV